LAAPGRLLGFGAKRGAEIGRALGIRTGDELREAARAGRLREVPGIGPKGEAKIRDALERAPRRAPTRPLLIHRARPLVESIAAQLGGVPAGDPRRWKDASSHLAVAVPTDEPDRVRVRFAALPEIVALAAPDLSPNVRVVPGLDADMLRAQGGEIAAANEALRPFRILRGLECDIRRDGSLDAPDDVLAELDWLQLSLHAGQRLPRRELTKLVTEAMRHPTVRCLSHPTGRLIG